MQLVVQPPPIRLLRGEAGLDGVVFLEAAALRIDTEHLAGSELAAPDAAVAADIDGAGFRSTGDQPVLADGVAQRP